MADFVSEPIQLRTPSGVRLVVPAGKVINFEYKKDNLTADYTRHNDPMTEGEYFFTMYDILWLRLVSDEVLTGVDLQVKWYDQRTHDFAFSGPTILAATGID